MKVRRGALIATFAAGAALLPMVPAPAAAPLLVDPAGDAGAVSTQDSPISRQAGISESLYGYDPSLDLTAVDIHRVGEEIVVTWDVVDLERRPVEGIPGQVCVDVACNEVVRYFGLKIRRGDLEVWFIAREGRRGGADSFVVDYSAIGECTGTCEHTSGTVTGTGTWSTDDDRVTVRIPLGDLNAALAPSPVLPVATDDVFEYPFASAGVDMHTTLVAGTSSSGGLTNYDSDQDPDGAVWFVE